MGESDRDAALLGRIAVKHRFITMDQLAEATRARGRQGKKLGAILVELGMIDELALGKILALQARHLKQAEARDKAPEDQPPRKVVGRVKKIPTPQDWVFTTDETEGTRPSRGADVLPRRGRRTPDVHPVSGRMDPRRKHTAPDGPSPGASHHPRRQAATAPDGPGGAVEPAHRRARTRPELESPPRVRAVQPRSERPTPVERPPAAADEPAPRDPAPRDWAAKEDALAVELPPTGGSDEPATDLGASTEPAPRSGVIGDAIRTEPSSMSSAPPPHSAAPASSELAPISASADEELPELEPRPQQLAASPTKAVEDLHRFLEAAAEHSASDVHVHAGQPLQMRQFGRLVPISDQPLSPAATERVLRELLTPWQRRQLDEHGEIDLAYSVAGVGRFRANIYIHHRGCNGVFHYVPPAPPTLEELALPTSLARLTNYAQGLILVTGPAGCGKTSTLAALVDIINAERNDHILTIEDPIEYLHPSKRCVVNQRQVGRHTTSFARALRGALREDPDIICIGELRDLETISLALSAAETGHLVLATLHTGSSIGTINRIVGAYPPNQQPQVRAMMSESLRAIISQRLVLRADGSGVIPALEVLYVNKAVGKCIRDNRTFQIDSVLQTGKAQGMQRLDDALFDLVAQGVITDEAAREHGSEGGR